MFIILLGLGGYYFFFKGFVFLLLFKYVVENLLMSVEMLRNLFRVMQFCRGEVCVQILFFGLGFSLFSFTYYRCEFLSRFFREWQRDNFQGYFVEFFLDCCGFQFFFLMFGCLVIFGVERVFVQSGQLLVGGRLWGFLFIFLIVLKFS